MIGASREMVSRVMKEMEMSGHMSPRAWNPASRVAGADEVARRRGRVLAYFHNGHQSL